MPSIIALIWAFFKKDGIFSQDFSHQLLSNFVRLLPVKFERLLYASTKQKMCK